MIGHPMREQTCEGQNPMSAAGRDAGGKDPAPGQAAKTREVPGSGTPRRSNATVHDPARAVESKRRRSTCWIAREHDRIRMRRTIARARAIADDAMKRERSATFIRLAPALVRRVNEDRSEISHTSSA